MSRVGGVWLRPLTRMTLNDLTSMECFSRGLWIACLLLRPNLWSFFYYRMTLWELGYLRPLTPCAGHGSRVPNPLRCERHGLHYKRNGLCTSGGGERGVLLKKWTSLPPAVLWEWQEKPSSSWFCKWSNFIICSSDTWATKCQKSKKMIFQLCDYDQMLFRLADAFIQSFFTVVKHWH